MSNKFLVSFTANGVGPHFDSTQIHECSFSVSGLLLAVYAENGTGKTFLSRMFALSSEQITQGSSDSFISIGKTHGKFEFRIKDTNTNTILHDYRVDLQRGQAPSISLEGKEYKFHVFNRDYVINNIESTGYSPDGNISGYILGRENIDVSSEKANLEQLTQNIKGYIDEIDNEIKLTQKELRAKGIAATLSEFRSITRARVLGGTKSGEEESYDVLCTQLIKLKSIPDSIPSLVISHRGISTDCLDVVSDILLTSYSRARFDEEAMERIKKVQLDTQFFQAGVMKYEQSYENRCPFCNQELSEYGIYIINLYKEYFNQQEAQVINEIEKNIGAVKHIISDIKDYIDTYNKMINLFLQYREYIPEFSGVSCVDVPEFSTIESDFTNIIYMLESKKKDISNTNYDITKQISNILDYKSTIEKIFYNQKDLSQRLENRLQDSDRSRKVLHRRICNAHFDALVDRCSDRIEKIAQLQREKESLDFSIREKEGTTKTLKKEIVIKDLERLLTIFFHDKYTFDPDTFGVSFMNESLDKRAKDVLSEGEKSILAFCYYLASAHLLISKEQDYDDLFFILDDPISSLDFRYVYAVSDIIRNLKNVFPQITSHERYIIFTHNAEFMSILMRNRIPILSLHMTHGKIVKMKQELLMPYEAHLYDLVQVANRKTSPTHTTPNSIRQVLETIMHFEDPSLNSIEQYILSNETLNKDAYIYSLMQDGSHGAIRKQPPISDEDIICSVSTVIKFVRENYPDQLKNLA